MFSLVGCKEVPRIVGALLAVGNIAAWVVVGELTSMSLVHLIEGAVISEVSISLLAAWHFKKISKGERVSSKEFRDQMIAITMITTIVWTALGMSDTVSSYNCAWGGFLTGSALIAFNYARMEHLNDEADERDDLRSRH